MPNSVLGAAVVAVGEVEALPSGSLPSSGASAATEDTRLCDVTPVGVGAKGRGI